MKLLILILALMLVVLTGCITYQDADGQWRTQSAFKDLPAVTTGTLVNVEVLPQSAWDAKCLKVKYRGCTIGNTIYVQGAAQSTSMNLSPIYVNNLPNDQGRAGDMLAEKLGLELSFNDREALGHEFNVHIIGVGRD